SVRLSTEAMDLDLGAESGPNAAVDSAGNLYVVWASGSWSLSKARTSADSHKTTASETNKAKTGEHGGHDGHSGKGAPPRPGNLNIYLVRSSDDGKTFSHPIRVNDDPDGPEHRFPTVVTDRNGSVYVGWLDKRLTSADRPNFCRVF